MITPGSGDPDLHVISTRSTATGRGRWLLAGVVVAICFLWLVPSFAPYGDIVNTLRAALPRASPALMTITAVVVIGNLATPSISQVAALPGLRFNHAAALDLATTTITNSVPGGSAAAIGVSWTTYRRLGFSNDEIGRSVVVTGVLDQLVKLGLPLPAIIWLLAEQRELSADASVSQTLIVRSAVAAAILFAVALGLGAIVLANAGVGARLTHSAGRVADRLINPLVERRTGRRVNWQVRLGNLRTDTRRLLVDRGAFLVASTVVGHANLFILLMLCLRLAGAQGTAVGWAAGLAAFTFARLTTAIPLTPGALGVAEVSLIGALDLVTDAKPATLVSSVVLFRAFSYVAPTLLGVPSLAVVARIRSRGNRVTTPIDQP